MASNRYHIASGNLRKYKNVSMCGIQECYGTYDGTWSYLGKDEANIYSCEKDIMDSFDACSDHGKYYYPTDMDGKYLDEYMEIMFEEMRILSCYYGELLTRFENRVYNVVDAEEVMILISNRLMPLFRGVVKSYAQHKRRMDTLENTINKLTAKVELLIDVCIDNQNK